MANVQTSEDGIQEQPLCSLTKAVEEVSQHHIAKTEELKEEQRTLVSLQEILSDIEKSGERADQELRAKVREILILEGEFEDLEQQTKILIDQYASISKENTALHIQISEEEERIQVALAGFSTYQQKMEGHRMAVSHAAQQTEAHRNLQEKKELVQMLKQKKKELKENLENPNGDTVQRREIDALKEEISMRRTALVERRDRLQKEFQAQAQIKRDMEIQNRRYEAIIKRLCCQLNRVQSANRQISDDIYHMKRQLAEQQQSSPD
ncbi:coiled-coil domain-containing protein 122 [Pholidichthys leucotaenia]